MVCTLGALRRRSCRRGYGGFPETMGEVWVVRVVSILVCWGLFWGALILGNHDG